MKTLALVFAIVAAVPAVAAAQNETRGEGWEFGVDLVYQDSTDITFNGGSRASLEDDFGVALNFGYRFNERLELGFALDWQSIDYRATLQSAQFPGVQVDVSGDLESFTPRGWLNYNFMPGPVTPYVTGGIGWSFVDTNIPNSRVQVGCWWDPWWGQICTPYQSTKSIDDFVYHVGAGVRWDVSPGYTVRLAYEKHWFDYGKATSTPDFDQFKLGIALRY